MSAIFVHGVPDTFHLWDGVLSHLPDQSTRALTLPGFGTDRPHDVDASKEAYVRWIISEIESESAPVDLVGHDWGGILVARVASLRPDLIRTWAAGGGPVSSRYVWHPLAQIWQMPGAGEEWMAGLRPAALQSDLVQNHSVPPALAEATAGRVDATMRDSILRLYRSGVTVGSEWEPALSSVRTPGLVFWGVDDKPCPVEYADELAEATGAELLRLQSGHWTPLEKPAALAAALVSHWAL